jgi:diguanylate cyclase (GGDEF)-like protein
MSGDSPLRSVRSALAVPLLPWPAADLDLPGAGTMTDRDHRLYRAATRRTMRVATGLAGITVALLASIDAVGMASLFPARLTEAVAINGVEGIIGLCLAAVALGPARRWPTPLAFGLAFSTVVTVLHLLVFVPESRVTSFMLLALLPPSVALFLPWTATVQAAWVLAGAGALVIFAVSSAGHAVAPTDWTGAWLVLTISGLASLVGCLGAGSVRRAAFARQMELRRSRAGALAREAELGRLTGELARAARTDPLTGLGNRLRLNDELAAATARSARYGNDCAVALLDLDHFKDYNDSLGHVAGDAALQAIATTLRTKVRGADTVHRFGGEEFVVLMPEQGLAGACQAAERLRVAVAECELSYPIDGGTRVLTISAGVALLGRRAALDGDEVLRAADAALYRAKHAGRNRVVPSPGAPDRSLTDEQPTLAVAARAASRRSPRPLPKAAERPAGR